MTDKDLLLNSKLDSETLCALLVTRLEIDGDVLIELPVNSARAVLSVPGC